MTTYTAEIGADRIAFLTDTGSTLGCAGLLDHVAAEQDQPNADTMVFDNAVASVLRELSEDDDGHMSDGQIWFGGLGYPVQVAD